MVSCFFNKAFNKYCLKNDIKLINGRPRHPQTQGAVERYNRTIKDLLKNIYLECEKKNIHFNINYYLKEVVDLYNNIKHMSTRFSPYFIFNNNNEI